jgi:glycosyltransferase involved in cell wall biosynthesis
MADTILKVLHILSKLDNGGVASYVKSICGSTGYSDIQHDLLLIEKNDKSTLEAVKVLSISAIKNKPISLFLFLIDTLKHYDAIFIHSTPYLLTLLLYFFNNKRIFLFQHGFSSNRKNRLYRFVRKRFLYIIPFLLKAKVICFSEFAYKKTISNGIKIARENVIFLPIGTSFNVTINDNRVSNSEITIGFAGVLAKIKRVDWLITSLNYYQNKYALTLLIAGDGPEREFLESLIKKIKNPKIIVKFLGNVNNMDEFYSSIDLFIFPSHNESFGLVVLEALVRKIPVVVFRDLGGALELIRNNFNGKVLNPTYFELSDYLNSDDFSPEKIMMWKNNINITDYDKFNLYNSRAALENLIIE